MQRRIACFAMPDRTHFTSVLAVAGELVRAGGTVCVWSDQRFRVEIEAEGAQFADLFATAPLAEIDNHSIPRSARYVTFAGMRGAEVAAEVAAWQPDLVVSEAFAMISQVVAKRLALPWVKVMAGHAVVGATYRARLERDPKVAIGPRCHEAVARLRSEFGFPGATPFSYTSDPSPWLNLCKEPEEWMTPEDIAQLGPLAFFGSLRSDAFDILPARAPADGLRVYASFGTIIWRYWTQQATAALQAIAAAVGQRPGASLVVGLGGATIDPAARRQLEAIGVRVEDYADQWAELGHADVFVTHNGVGSTHEAVARLAPMLSLPFFWDQPDEARRAQELGIALPLIDGVAETGALTSKRVSAALDRLLARRSEMQECLLVAREWERRTIAGRQAVARQVLAVGR